MAKRLSRFGRYFIHSLLQVSSRPRGTARQSLGLNQLSRLCDGIVTREWDVDVVGHTTTYNYDVLNRKTSTIDALGGIVTLNYDANNNLLNLTDPVGNQTQWQYDALNRQTLETDPLSKISTMAYDAVDRVTSATDRNGQIINYSYDLLNREIGETWIIGTITQNLLTFTYDPNNNLLTAANNTGTITRTYDALDRLSTTKDMFSTLVTSSYDAANNRLVTQDSFGGIVTRTFDSLNRMATMSYTGQTTALREDFVYSARDQVTNQTRFSNLNGTTTVGYSTFGYDPVGRLTNLQHLNGSLNNIANLTNTYDLASRITSEVLNGGAPTTYSYDITNQLTNDSVVTYSYDLNGNRTMSGYSTGPANELLSDGVSSYSYDRNGNLVQKVNISTGETVTYRYDNRNRMITVTDTTTSGLQMQATYSYDALGQRIEKDVWAGGVATVTQMAYDDGRQVWVDMNGSSALQTQYLRTGNVLELPARVSSGGTAAWLLTDRMGSIRNVVNSTGAVIDTVTYDGYGNGTQSNVTNGGLYLYVGYRYDSETMLFRPDPTTARYYSPEIGRWQSIDPTSFQGMDSNLFRYVFNYPTGRLDPTGLACADENNAPNQKSCGPDVTDWFKKEIQLFTDAAKVVAEIRTQPNTPFVNTELIFWRRFVRLGRLADYKDRNNPAVNPKNIEPFDYSKCPDPDKNTATLCGVCVGLNQLGNIMAGVIAVNAGMVKFTRDFGLGIVASYPGLGSMKPLPPWTAPGEAYRKFAFELGVDLARTNGDLCKFVQGRAKALNDSSKYNTDAGTKKPCCVVFNGPNTDMERDPLTDKAGNTKPTQTPSGPPIYSGPPCFVEGTLVTSEATSQ
jgi:RHS repeat-associated protein